MRHKNVFNAKLSITIVLILLQNIINVHLTRAQTSCQDAVWAFTVTLPNGNNVRRDCTWVAENAQERCPYDNVDEKCPETCGDCSTSYPSASPLPCEDNPSTFLVTLSSGNQRYRDCVWVSSNKEDRCAFEGVIDECPQTCETFCSPTVSPVSPTSSPTLLSNISASKSPTTSPLLMPTDNGLQNKAVMNIFRDFWIYVISITGGCIIIAYIASKSLERRIK